MNRTKKVQTLYLIRHAETTYDGKYIGTTNCPLSRKGLKQAHRLGKRFQSVDIDYCFVSPLKRARQTAGFILGKRTVPRLHHPLLREIDFGLWEGHVYRAAHRKWPRVFTHWDKSPHKVHFPRGESFGGFWKRVNRFSRSLMKRKEDTVAVISHGGTTAALLMSLLDRPLKEFWKWTPPLASVAVLTRNLNGTESAFVLRKVKDVAHLGHLAEKKK